MEEIRLLFAGDFCATNPSDIVLSDELRRLFDSADIKAVNFEGPLSTGLFAGPNKTILKQSEDSPLWCEQNGFNIVSLANNHLLDYGQDGCQKTVDAFRSSTVIGAGSWESAYEVKYIECKGRKLGFFSASSADLASLQDKWTESEEIGAAWINHPSVNHILQEAKLQCDFLFVIVHAGVEYMPVPLPEWRERYKEIVDLGADAVIAAHPHVVQGWEVYKGHPIFYSLGNFYFDFFSENCKPDKWDNGMLSCLIIKANGGLDATAIPTYKDGNQISCDNSIRSKEYIDSLVHLLSNDDLYLSKVNEYVLKSFCKYKCWLLSGLGAQEYNGFGIKPILKYVWHILVHKKPNYRVALHQIREESTRYLLVRAMRLIK